MTKKLIIIGASGHGKVVADIARLNGYSDIKFLDDDVSKKNCSMYDVVGKSDSAINYNDHDFIIAIGNADIRQKIQLRLLDNGLHVITLAHPNSVIASDVEIGKGTVIMAGAVINSSSYIGDGVIINTASSVDHDCIINDFAHISVGSHISGTCNIGERTWIGAGATVSNNISICADCMIGTGAVVVKNIDEKGTYVGVPARLVK